MADHKNTHRGNQVEAIERSIPKIFEVEDKLKLSSSMLKEIKDWVVGEDYTVTLKVTELAARELENGEIEAEFEIKSAKST